MFGFIAGIPRRVRHLLSRFRRFFTKPQYENFYRTTLGLMVAGEGARIPHLAEFIDERTRNDLRERMTRLFRMMAWAHRDYSKWDEVHEYLAILPEESRDHHSGPVYHEKWYGRTI